MKKQAKWIFVAMVSMVLLLGCTEKEEEIPKKQGIEERWETSLQHTNGTKFIYTIENTSQKDVYFTFLNRMPMDYTLIKDGMTLYTQSNVIPLRHEVDDITLHAKERFTYEIALDELEAGDYELLVSFTANEAKKEDEKSLFFTVE